MTRKDSEKDSERPHYYSQFWLDVAAGRRVIGMPKTEDGEQAEIEIPEPIAPRKSVRASEFSTPSSDGHGRAEMLIHPVVEPVVAPQEFIEPDQEEETVAEEEDAVLDLQNPAVDDTDIPDMDLGPTEDEDEDEEDTDEEFFEDEEEEDDMGWGGTRGRKKPVKPVRPVKPPVKKPGKRERRSGY